MKRRIALKRLLQAALLWSSAGYSHGADPKRKGTEAEIKTAYIYNFALFTMWPTDTFAEPESPFVIATLGDHSFGPEFARSLSRSKAGERAIKVVEALKGEKVPDCHILYIAPSERPRLEEILREVRGKPILTVGEAEPFCSLGGCVRFDPGNKRLGLVINPEAVAGQRLRISSDLLAIARIVPTGK